MAQIGMLDPLDGSPPATQPGGPSTRVTSPTNQPDSSYPGAPGVPSGPAGSPWVTPNAAVSRYSPACGHKISRFEVRKEPDGSGLAFLAVMRCPSCGLIAQRLPWDVYLDNSLTPVVIG